ncbi:NTT2 [Hepatospora eriocheir]|nr:NTT2 [Hepatospora eriocheir]
MLTKQAKKDKGGMGLTATLRSCINSKLLTSLAILCFSYNFSSFINQTNAECCYEAYYDFLVMNPSQNVKNVVVEKSLLINSFRSMVSNSISLCVIWIMLSPLFNRMFNKLGVLGFSICQPIFSELAAISMLIWATNNLNQIDDVKPAFNFSLPFSFTSNILMECNFAAFFDAAIKITKFAFYDFYVEYIYASIEVSKRSRYKNIVNSVFGKGGQTLGAVVFLLLEMCGMGSKTRQVLPIVFVMISIISIIAIFCCFYLNKIYKEADKNNKFITDDPFFNKSQ